ncbi:DUF1320 domain-containing protein [Desulfobulbus sp.]|uniref:gp436 family protein n=1 Tax=Desulfobulbus sp. TaxID=895 RepID=UPI00286F71FB|nr:DUF1320 domain-containing protein [Desulfobulbus sp.]
MYCAANDIRSIMPEMDLIELTDDTIPPVSANDEVIDRAITDAGELIDGYLRGRYTLPLAPVPRLLNTLAADVAVYRLYARRLRLTPPEIVTERYKNVLKILEQIQAGKISLGAETSGGGVVPSAGGPQCTTPDRVFTRETLRDY